MRRRTLAVGAAAAAVLVTLGACSNAGTTSTGPSPSAGASSMSASATEAHNEADVTFAQQMIPHHQQAVEMSDMVLGKQGIDPRVLDLAKQIKAAQTPEIDTMQTWLKQWGTPAEPTMSSMPGMSEMPGTSGMVGMMSSDDMAALQNAQGVAAAKLYLTQMVQHHTGAIGMAQTEIGKGQNAGAIALAHSIVTSQQQEIDTMNKILASL